MTERVSVVLPTRTWGPACENLAAQLGDGDELLVVCDTPADPVYRHEGKPRVTVVAAGEPSGCAGKANALAAGLATASGTILVCTDDDIDHGDDWLARVVAAVEKHGAVSTIPCWRSTHTFGTIIEPMGLLMGPLVLVTGGQVWGGTIGFRRELVDVAALTADLRRTVGDDFVVGEHLGRVRIVPSLSREVRVVGTFDDVTARGVRFARQFLLFTPELYAAFTVCFLLGTVSLLLAPLPTCTILAAVAGLCYVAFGYHRWTFLLAGVGPPVVLAYCLYGLVQSEFDWGGRRYRWTGKYEVEVVEQSGTERS